MKTIKLFLVFIILLSFPSCATNKFNYDKKIPEEQQCVLVIPEDFTIVKFNERTVRWKVGYNMFYTIIDNLTQNKREAVVKIPEGEHTLIINYKNETVTPTGYNAYSRRIRSAEGIVVTYDFLHGNTYKLVPIIIGDRITIIIRRQ
jgi:hypothetical protein